LSVLLACRFGYYSTAKEKEKGVALPILLNFTGGYAMIILRHKVHILPRRVCVFTLVKTQAQFSHTLWGNGNFVSQQWGYAFFGA